MCDRFVSANPAGAQATVREYNSVRARLAELEREWLSLSEVVERLLAEESAPAAPASRPRKQTL